MPDYVTITNGVDYYVVLDLSQLHEFPAWNWKRLMRLAAKFQPESEAVLVTLSEWFPEAIQEAKREHADATTDYALVYRDPASLPRGFRTEQDDKNKRYRRKIRLAENKLKKLQALYSVFKGEK